MLKVTDFSWLDDESWTRPATPEEFEKYNCEYMVTDDAPPEVRESFFKFVEPVYDYLTGERVYY